MSRRRRGFTLLEVLVATVIMTVAIGGALSALSATMRNAARLTDHDRAAMLARRKVDELLAEKRLPRRQMLQGLYDASMTNGRASGWKAMIFPFEVPPNPGPGTKILDRIEVQIWWTTAGRTQTYSLEAFRRAPVTQEEIASGALLPQ